MVPLLFLLLALVIIGLPIWALFKILSLEQKNARLERRLSELEHDFSQARGPAPTEPHPAPEASSVPLSTAAVAPPPPFAPTPALAPPTASSPVRMVSKETSAVPPFPRAPETPASRASPAPVKPRFNWEQFTGAKLLAWTGGAAAFLGAAFFIKYSFEHELIPPAVRAAIGYAFAVALVIGGLMIPRRRYAVTAQTLCATGIVCLYAVTFACSSIYDFPFFTPIRTFLLMAVITGSAFVLAVRLRAQVVAVLGMLGGFLTPVLLATGRDNAFGLFGYIALLDLGLVALALHQRWLFLVPLSAVGTVALQLGWASKFLTAAKSPTAMVIGLVFCGIFLAAFLIAERFRPDPRNPRPDTKKTGSETSSGFLPQFYWPAFILPSVALLFALGFIGYRSVAAQPALLFGFVFAADACLLALAWFGKGPLPAHLIGGGATFVLLATWTAARLTDDLLGWALGLYLVHGVIHTTFPLLLQKRRPGSDATTWNQLFPPLALLLMFVPLLKLDAVSFAFWPCVLAVDLLAIGLALLSGSILGVATVFVLTLAATALWMFRLPPALMPESSALIVVGGFAVLFFAAGILFARGGLDANKTSRGGVNDPRVQLPAFSALLPFVLLVLITQRLPTPNPSGVFGLALLLVVLGLGLTRALLASWLPACALAGVVMLEYAWHARHFSPASASMPLAWYLGFYAVFTIFPFGFRRNFSALTGPWAVAALGGVAQFPLVYNTVQRSSPNHVLGVIPALFAVAPFASLLAIRRAAPTDDRARLNQLAWFGGVALLFVTLIIPIQFERQWITLGWALEGAALLWLFRRVPHPGLRGAGVGLLIAAFARLSLNPAVLEYHARSGAPIFNWFLYTYGIVIACLFAGAVLVREPEEQAFGVRIPPWLNSLGTVLSFLLLNIEIADFFSPPGARILTFEFSGNFARDMTYTIAWALFALGLLLISIWKRARAGRYAALALLGIAVLKLFVHDLARLGALYRIGALFAVAIIAIVASLAYQRFLPGDDAPVPKRE